MEYTMQGQIKHLDISYFTDANQKFLKTLKSLNEIKTSIELAKASLMEVWVGKSRDAFENQYNMLFSKISDINEALDEMYNSMVDSECAYRETDDALRQEFVMSMQG